MMRSAAELARQHRLPMVADGRDFAVAGALFALAPNYSSMARRSAWYVDAILRGAAPGDLPAEQMTEFKLFINLKTAKGSASQSRLRCSPALMRCSSDLAPTPAATARQPHLCLGLILLVLFPRRVLTPYASGERLCDMQKNHRYVYVFLILLMILMGALLLL